MRWPSGEPGRAMQACGSASSGPTSQEATSDRQAAIATGSPLTGFATTSWLALAGMALGPQLFGHIGLNYAVKYVPAATVAALLLLEPVGASLLGALLLGEFPTLQEILGGLLILVGVGATSIKGSDQGADSST